MMLKRRPQRRELVEAVLGLNKATSAATARVEKNIAKLYADYFARVKALVNSPRELKAGQKSDLVSTLKAMDQLTTILEESGFEDVIQKYIGELEGLTQSAIAYYDVFGLEKVPAGVSRETLKAYIRFTEKELRDFVPRKLVAPLQSALLQVNFGNVERSEIYNVVQNLEDSLTTSQAVTLVNDTFASYQRAVIVETGNALDLEIYVYLGPEDEKTSDQCETMLNVDYHGVPGMLYKDEITVDLDENLTRNPLIGGGHPNCRHHWSPITADYAESQGFELRKEAA